MVALPSAAVAPANLDDLDDAELDRLAFGVIGLGMGGVVVRYNRREAERSGLSRWRVIGRELREIANAMAAAGLVDRVRAFAAARESEVGFLCPVARRGRRGEACVVLRRGGARAQVYVCISSIA